MLVTNRLQSATARLQSATAGRLRFDAEALERRERDAERELRSLRRAFDLHKVFMEVGAGDCALARRAAGYVERVYALDVSEDAMGRLSGPPNLVRVVHDGVRIPLPEGGVDVAFSRALVISQLAGICRTLRANVNLIRYNEVQGLPYKRPESDDVMNFQAILRNNGVNAHVRKSRGRDIDAACGQLRRKEQLDPLVQIARP